MRLEYEELSCPFCDNGRVSTQHLPSTYSVKRTMVGSNRKNIPHKSSEVWLIQSGCSKCGKSKEEVEKQLKEKGII
jgi:hypothetical protein